VHLPRDQEDSVLFRDRKNASARRDFKCDTFSDRAQYEGVHKEKDHVTFDIQVTGRNNIDQTSSFISACFLNSALHRGRKLDFLHVFE